MCIWAVTLYAAFCGYVIVSEQRTREVHLSTTSSCVFPVCKHSYCINNTPTAAGNYHEMWSIKQRMRIAKTYGNHYTYLIKQIANMININVKEILEAMSILFPRWYCWMYYCNSNCRKAHDAYSIILCIIQYDSIYVPYSGADPGFSIGGANLYWRTWLQHTICSIL